MDIGGVALPVNAEKCRGRSTMVSLYIAWRRCVRNGPAHDQHPKATLNFKAKFFLGTCVIELDIGLIRDEANVGTESLVSVILGATPPCAHKRRARGVTSKIPASHRLRLGSLSQAASMASSSSRSTPQIGATVVPLARVQKLKAKMATAAITSSRGRDVPKSEAEWSRGDVRDDGLKVRVKHKPFRSEPRVLFISPTIDLSRL
ncbi:hypothetical protein H5410_057508, partial [Solanum commersonii]